GGAAKGYAVDRALEVLKGQGIERALVNAGGQIGILGEAPRGLWRVGVKDPREAGLLTVLEVKEGAVSTSGDYQRFFISGGRRYHHLVDPTTGYPAWDCQSATVVAETGLLADLLSTACFIMGPEMGMALVERYGAEALVVDKDGRVHATGDLCYEPVKGRD
ncbi:MAG TPA: FAD:protein FMN transferase, partial [Bacillota bacterium]|nr:FAD:protein FMN transferase [Bacillota bacterium]